MASAVSWWEAAARNGIGQAALNAAVAYSKGDGVSQDIEKAKEWALVAGESGLTSGFVILGNLELENAKDIAALRRAKEWFVQAAKAGDVDGQYSVGLACQHLGARTLNDGVLQQINDCYQTGRTSSDTQKESLDKAVAVHLKEALLWFYLAEENGSEAALELVSSMEKILGVEVVRAVKEYEPQFRRMFADGEV